MVVNAQEKFALRLGNPNSALPDIGNVLEKGNNHLKFTDYGQGCISHCSLYAILGYATASSKAR